jgi:hypothetical protein
MKTMAEKFASWDKNIKKGKNFLNSTLIEV